MKQACFFLFVISVIVSCGGKENDPPYSGPDPIVDSVVLTPIQISLVAHTWLFDSLKSDRSDSGPTVIEPEPKMELIFHASTYEARFSPTTINTLQYEIEAPNKMYRWLEINGKDTSEYSFIETVTDMSLVLSSPTNNYKTYEFYSAK